MRFLKMLPAVAAAVSSLAIACAAGSAHAEGCEDYSLHMHFMDNILRGGNVQDLILHGDYAMSVGWEAPVVVGQTETSLYASRIIIRDGYAFLATDVHGLQVFDVSSPTSADCVHKAPIPSHPEDIVV